MLAAPALAPALALALAPALARILGRPLGRPLGADCRAAGAVDGGGNEGIVHVDLPAERLTACRFGDARGPKVPRLKDDSPRLKVL